MADPITDVLISFDADAITEHFEGAPDEHLIEGLDDETLDKIGAQALEFWQDDDRIWVAWHEAVSDVLKEERSKMEKGVAGLNLKHEITVKELLGLAHWLVDGHDENPEYTRGVVELICDAAGLSTDHKGEVEIAIRLGASSEVADG